ncbi:DHA2 family efflux MFS transporter permease subunit [Arthrobacter gengyunqii]|uniref:DHA2 family efflux MFS transporter permease subunit n=1 Tax=Arthrobacter gengyunqii TaxID=2886940 RepID=A0A9X1S6L5_9MICC|nr:MFS transporter [Arthrobacter gengyunqii]MCC3265088.1 DHA2 family efflux MFS transporter permease subunit [Arthrobacter gengyunqii]MCC3269216.1 DHA2 family efflux MFS transporter permease subunit [Arthrobacter gengyunqii]UOY94827.1 DHA2 family efflux MFS transporter permease subunit [Arthrobacter gengyunqii]
MDRTTPAGLSPAVDHSAHPHRWLLLSVLALAQLMVVLDGTIVNIALPDAQLDLGMSDGDRTWVVTIYALAFGSLLLLGGRIADYWGRKRTFMVGMLGFAAASALGGFASSTEMLLAARGLQGAFAALLAPASLAILTITFPSGKDRIKAFAVYGAIGGGGAAIGLLLGGVLTQYASWHWCLLVNVPIAVVAIAAGLPLIRESKAHGNTRYDLPGAVLVVAGLASLVYGFAQAEEGWVRVETIGFLVAGVVILAAFVFVESKVSNPLLPLRVLANRVRGGAFLISALTGAALLGGILFLVFYFQIVLGYSPLKSGLASLPMTLAITAGAGVLSKFLPRTGVRLPMTLGPVVGAVGLFWLSFITVEGNYALEVLPGLILLGFGLAMIFVPLQNVALAGIDEHDAGVASAAVSATQQIGGSIGTALFTAIYTAAMTSYLSSNEVLPGVQAGALVSGYSAAFMWAGAAILLAAPIGFFMIRPAKEDLLKVPAMAHAG